MKNEECRNQTVLRRKDVGFANRHSSFVIVLAALCALLPLCGFGQSSNRWLLIFETSSSMRARAMGVEEITRDLLSTAMHGQIRKGDSIGIWTFSDKLRAGDAPLQIWTPESGPTIAQHTVQFLRNQQYAKSGNLNVVITNMLRVVGMSDIITVFLFTDSDGAISGTPFDDSINEYYKGNYKDLKKANMPMVTIFRGERGYITTNTQNLAPWPVEIPPLPVRLPPKPVVKPHVEAPKPPPAVAPIILDGRKSGNAAPVENNPSETAPPAASPVMTNSAPRSEAPVSAPPAANVQTPSPAAPTVIVATPEAPSAKAPSMTSPAQSSLSQGTEGVVANQPSSNSAAAVVAPISTPPAKSEPPRESETAGATPATHLDVQTGTSAPGPNLFSSRNILIASVAFTVLVVGLLLISARNSRSQASLITRSFDRENQ